MTLKKLALGAGLTMALGLFSACGGGGGGSSSSGYVDPSDVARYPYETVFGDACRATSEVTPGCTFSRATGLRVTVSADPMYNSQGYGSDDLYYVKFDSVGVGRVYDDLGNVQQYTDIYGVKHDKLYTAADFAGYINGTSGANSQIGVGLTGAFWESVSGKTYWFGKNGVLYSANVGAANYGQAINNRKADQTSNSNSKAVVSEENIALIEAGAENLENLGLEHDKAIAVASAMNSMAVMSVERGAITASDYNRAFKAMTGGVEYGEAVSAFVEFTKGNKAPARSLVSRSGKALGLKPEEAEAYVKGLSKSLLGAWGYDADAISLQEE